MNLENKTVFITGANGGLGSAFVKEFLNYNVKKIYCSARDISKLDSIKKLSNKIELIELDITNKEQFKSLALTIGEIDILINNAGANSAKRLFDNETLDFDVNLFGTLNSCRILSENINNGGIIINISSVLALINLPIMALYCASKSALHSITQALRAELKTKDISVYEVLPGPIDTTMSKDLQMPKTSPNDIVKATINGLNSDEYEIYPDSFAKVIRQRLEEDRINLENEFAQSINY
ncbi:SDR family NAD(P)-dependent oxidoreductase [Arcobacter sp.]|uniref:SDR family NAD(P)-dependent oxidoreductase n=1 Tax=unclassified Arcobacter TaxID=2593671 RepID=UPI003B00026A